MQKVHLFIVVCQSRISAQSRVNLIDAEHLVHDVAFLARTFYAVFEAALYVFVHLSEQLLQHEQSLLVFAVRVRDETVVTLLLELKSLFSLIIGL